jgi:hypothetical protein
VNGGLLHRKNRQQLPVKNKFKFIAHQGLEHGTISREDFSPNSSFQINDAVDDGMQKKCWDQAATMNLSVTISFRSSGGKCSLVFLIPHCYSFPRYPEADSYQDQYLQGLLNCRYRYTPSFTEDRCMISKNKCGIYSGLD